VCIGKEVIVVDGNADADCEQLCQQYAVKWLPSDACRGLQLDAGAQAAIEAADADVLWFVHADSVVHANALEEISNSIKAGAIGGYFRFGLIGLQHWRLQLFTALTNWRTQIGVPYGDQGLFMTVAAYQQAAGFAHLPLFEEVRLVKRLRRLGRFKMLPYVLATSPRRWQRDGWLRRIIINRGLAVAYGLGVPAERLHTWYIRHHHSNSKHQSSAVNVSPGP